MCEFGNIPECGKSVKRVVSSGNDRCKEEAVCVRRFRQTAPRSLVGQSGGTRHASVHVRTALCCCNTTAFFEFNYIYIYINVCFVVFVLRRYVTEWLMTMFCRGFSFDLVSRVFDVFTNEVLC